MTIPENFVQTFEFVHPHELIAMMRARSLPPSRTIVEITNEIKPVDLYCYLGGRFGQPNGIQNFLRADDSDNLIHWEWTLRSGPCLVSFQGMNFRTEVHLHGNLEWEPSDREALVAQIKADFGQHGAQMSVVRSALEHWIEFVNPYKRIRNSINGLLEELKALDLHPETDKMDNFACIDMEEIDDFKRRSEDVGRRYSKGFGLCFGIRSMIPVLAEAFVNLLLYVLMKPELKSDQRLRDNTFRQPIDVRIKSLSINCNGFQKQPDYTSEPCKRYHSLVNERNDLLHGNVVIEKLKFNEVNFFGKVPVFCEYRTMWERSIGIGIKSVGLNEVLDGIAVVDDLIAYLISCIEDRLRPELEHIKEQHVLAINTKTRRLGILFPPWLVDFRVDSRRHSTRQTPSKAE